MKVVTISVSEPGRRIAERLPYEHVHGKAAATLASRWSDADGFVMVLALGATVRLIAPHLDNKMTDPAVVCVDDAGTFAISVCGGHGRGANALATEVASLLGGQPVVTTATDRLGLPALDQLEGMKAEGDIAGVTAAMLAGDPIAFEPMVDWPLSGSLSGHLGGSLGTEETPPDAARIVVSDRAFDGMDRPRTVALRPPSLVVGIGTTADATGSDACDAVDRALSFAGLSALSVAAVATIDRRAGHPALEALSRRWRCEVTTFAAQELEAVDVPTPSEVVARAVGTRSVAEAAALAAAGADSTLVLEKFVSPTVTVAVARRARPRGALFIVGLGPGSASQRTQDATRAVRHAEVVVGLDAYVAQCADLLTTAHDVRRFPIGAEMVRVRLALELAVQGKKVALVCSGDAGIYALASPALEEVRSAGRYRDLEVTVVPGVTAGVAAAALLGAPLGHDFLTLSLSDLLTPWEVIETRVRAAAESDLVVVLYNPRSSKRTWQIEKARSILLEHRASSTPVGLVTDAGRPGQIVRTTTLGDLDCEEVNMTTCVIVGSSLTRVLGGRMVTPRGYPR